MGLPSRPGSIYGPGSMLQNALQCWGGRGVPRSAMCPRSSSPLATPPHRAVTTPSTSSPDPSVPATWVGSRAQAFFSAWPVPPSPLRFKEIEAEDEMQPQHLQCTKGVQGLPPPAPPKLEPWGPPAPKVGPQPGTHVPTGAEHKGNRELGMATVPTSVLFPQWGTGLSTCTATQSGSRLPFVTTGYRLAQLWNSSPTSLSEGPTESLPQKWAGWGDHWKPGGCTRPHTWLS